MTLLWFYQFMKSQLLATLPTPTTPFTSQTVIVTGSNTGLGLEAARHVTRLGAEKIVLAVRTLSRGEQGKADIISSLVDERGSFAKEELERRIEVWELDVSSYGSIKAFVEKVDGLDRVDAVIQNAGIVKSTFDVLPGSGDEAVLATNLTGPVLFGLMMLPKLRKSAKKTSQRGRMTFVGSEMMYIAGIKQVEVAEKEGKRIFEVMNDREGTVMGERYSDSKILLYYAMREVAAQSPISNSESNVIINVNTPGLCHSELGRDMPLATRVCMMAMKVILARTSEVGSRALVHGVIPDLAVEAHGKFLTDCKVRSSYGGDLVDGPRSYKLQKCFTDELFTKLEKIQPGVTSCLESKV